MKNKKDGIELAAGCLGVIILIFLLPLLYFAGGYFTGLILKWLVGDAVIIGLNHLLDTTRFTVEMLPFTCGALGVVGSFFKTTNTYNSKK